MHILDGLNKEDVYKRQMMSRVWGWTELAKRSAAMKAPVGLLSGSAVLRKQDGGALPRQALPQQDHLSLIHI